MRHGSGVVKHHLDLLPPQPPIPKPAFPGLRLLGIRGWKPTSHSENFPLRIGGIFGYVEESMLYAPFATYRKAVGVSGEGEVLSVEDPVVVGIIGEGCLDTVDCGGNICGS